jgi:hypothetical protein
MIHTKITDFLKSINENTDNSLISEIISKYTNNINSRDDIESFFKNLINKLNLNLHPDDPFIDYTNDEDVNTFSDEQASEMEDIMDLCFEYCEENKIDIYEIGYEILRKKLDLGIGDDYNESLKKNNEAIVSVSDKLDKIFIKYNTINHNDDNYSIGGGLDGNKFASRRHEDAKDDLGKLTLGETTQLFKKATDLDIETIREIIQKAVPNMEWHHAGKIPKSYGGGMKKTYFIKANQIADIAKNWDMYISKLNISKEKIKSDNDIKKTLQDKKNSFLKTYAKFITRERNKPTYFYQTAQEMDGKYGWFDSTYKSYNMPEYYSGWEFKSKKKYDEFLNLLN